MSSKQRLPTPNQGESRSTFVSRCMNTNSVMDEFSDSGQRRAVCIARYQSEKGDDDIAEIEIKQKSGEIVEVKEEKRNGIPIGIISGYIATWDLDRGKDRFVKGAFSDHLEEYRASDRQIRLKDHHGRTIGGFPINTVKEDERGLFGRGEVNLEVQQGREAYSLARQKVLTDFSIGYRAMNPTYDNGTRIIAKSQVWEGSIVDEPMNPHANITEVKAITPRSRLPRSFADRGRRWDATAAERRVRAWAGAEDGPNTRYRNAHLYYNPEEEDNFTGYGFLVVDIIDGEARVIPRAVFAARAALAGARGGTTIPQADQRRMRTVINQLYEDLDLEAPFGSGNEERAFNLSEVKNLTKSTLCYIIQHKQISREASNYLAQCHFTATGDFGESDDSESHEIAKKDLIDIRDMFKKYQ